MKPIVTVGMCLRNCENTLKDAIDSVIKQDFPHELMEVIVVDGFSKDRTLRIVREVLSKSDINVKIFRENKGLGFARQMVVDNALGKYILWVDGDIILSKNYVKQNVDFMEKNPIVAIARGSFGLLPDDNLVAMLENVSYVIDSLRDRGKTTSRMLGTEGSILRVKAIKMAGGFDTNIKGAKEDFDVAYRLHLAGWKFHRTDATLYERQRKTWSDLWKQYFWYGYGLHFIQHKNKGRKISAVNSEDRTIIGRMTACLRLSFQAYKLTCRKAVFLLPLHRIFKRMAQIFGSLRAHMDGYGHHHREYSKP
jgi:glycosyltransferase involved in cell wall biosynthesis